jgi:serine/threonine protein kinase
MDTTSRALLRSRLAVRADVPPPPEPAVGDGSAEEALYADDLGPGAQAGSYVVESRWARGGFATVYRVRHARLGRIAALKALHMSLVTSPSMLRRFRQEAQAVNMIRHPNIVDIYEFGELTDGRPFFVMEWLEGRNVEQELRARGPLSVAEALAMVEDLGAALTAAHDRGIIHRDLKASNIILIPSGAWYFVKLVDFGIAKLTNDLDDRNGASGVRLGTPGSMAPEQIMGAPVDARTDIYALGVLLFQTLTGRMPFRGSSEAVEEMHLTASRPSVSDEVIVPHGMDELIRRCMHVDPAQRFATVDEVLRNLRRIVTNPRIAPASHTTVSQGINVYVEVLLDADPDTIDDGLLNHLSRVGDQVRETLGALGMQSSFDNTNAQLWSCELPAEATASREMRARVLAAALELEQSINSQRDSPPRSRVSICMNLAPMLIRVRPSQSALISVDRLTEWIRHRVDGAVSASTDVLADLEDRFETTPHTSEFVRVRRAR